MIFSVEIQKIKMFTTLILVHKCGRPASLLSILIKQSRLILLNVVYRHQQRQLLRQFNSRILTYVKLARKKPWLCKWQKATDDSIIEGDISQFILHKKINILFITQHSLSLLVYLMSPCHLSRSIYSAAQCCFSQYFGPSLHVFFLEIRNTHYILCPFTISLFLKCQAKCSSLQIQHRHIKLLQRSSQKRHCITLPFLKFTLLEMSLYKQGKLSL